MKLAVVGAHLSGLPLNYQLIDRKATLVAETRTAPVYRLFALPNTTPPKPGLMRVAQPLEHGIQVQVWDLEPAAFASFVESIPQPMCIGSIELESGETVKGFLAEPIAFEGATDITHLGGWRAYLQGIQ